MTTSGFDPRSQLSRTALIVWTAAVLVYVMAITGRTSMGVAGVAAVDHFHINAAQLAVFTSVQVGTYALVQIPMGILIDRFGARRLLFAGALIMAIGQIILGLTTSYSVAIFARVLVGAGDASAFLSVMRILPFWFPLKHTPLFTQLTAAVGQAGQFLSAVPFLALLGASGWRLAFLSLGGIGVLVALAANILIHDSPTEVRTKRTGSLLDVLRLPVCWMGFFNHFTMLMPLIVFNLLWGMPTMTLGMGLDESQAASVLVINTIVTILAGPLHGIISARAGRKRELFSLGYTVLLLASMIAFFMSTTPRGFLAIATLAGLLGLLGPAANYGFDTVRESLPHAVVTTGTGLANMGGFSAAMISAQGIGLLLAHYSDGVWTWADFRIAWWAVFVVWIIGIIGLVLTRALALRSPGPAVES
ncbi:MFS transporter [Corynebacterium sp. H127]|uniref:MFS transporter n=1 Tax=Corynebacterium sp. H127 TaxID=3133418 RepID=UPI0030B76196